MESKNHFSKINAIPKGLGFSRMVTVEPIGIGGGLSLLWKQDLDVEILEQQQSFLEATVRDGRGFHTWRVYFVHTLASGYSERKALWQVLKEKMCRLRQLHLAGIEVVQGAYQDQELLKWRRRSGSNSGKRIQHLQKELDQLGTNDFFDAEGYAACEEQLKQAYKDDEVKGIENSDGLWKEKPGDISQVVLEYFKGIFSSEGAHGVVEVKRCVKRCVSNEMNKTLIRSISAGEVRDALFMMGPSKALGPDGMTIAFFQEHWDIVGQDIVEAIQSFWHSGIFRVLAGTFRVLALSAAPIPWSEAREEDANVILQIPLPISPIKDKRVWHFTSSGVYSVKSGYELALMMKRNGLLGVGGSGEASNRVDMKEFWKRLWSLPVSGKIRHFLWKCCHNAIPVQKNLRKRGVLSPIGCPLCGDAKESIIHLVAQCPFARAVWSSLPMQIDSQALECSSFIHWWSAFMHRGQGCPDNAVWRSNMAYMVWGIWKSRNRAMFDHVRADPVWVMQHAVSSAAEFLNANMEDGPEKVFLCDDRHGEQVHWQPPSSGLVKINFDAAFIQNLNNGGVGVVARSDDGSFLFARASGGLQARSAIMMEGLVLRTGVLLAIEKGIRRVIFEGDAKGLIDALSGRGASREDIQLLVLDILQLCNSSFDEFSFVFVGRKCNSVAHELARKGCSVGNCSNWVAIPPLWLWDLICREKGSCT
ncbi:hypothetical protein Vadar_014084 [Vaccinium darrowii]|uniref:Uncharacterized protein n=1 Tax=Vaccinium darrowii TaxID=229202 RepID=A0ACB7ZBF3_9ERIC|nr:hypothetical protein Vadar_014084 [Vaccinium darrowii]